MAVHGRKARKRAAKKPVRARKVALARSAKARSPTPAAATARSELARLKHDLRAARDRQASSAEILRAIAAAPADAERSLQQIAETAERLFAASAVTIRIAGAGEDWSHVVNVGEGARLISAMVSAEQLKIGGHNMPSAIYLENRLVHLPDLGNVDPEIADWPGLRPSRAAGTRTLVGIPLRREGKAIGAMIVHRKRVAAFAADELALLQSFADQAVIAIENARLLNEVRARTDDLSEALQQQTATTEVLAVINSSAGNLAPVFDAILRKAHALCGVEFGSLQICDGENLRAVATHGFSERFAGLLRQGYRAVESPYSSALLAGERYVQTETAAEAEFPLMRAAAELDGIRTVLFVPLRKEGRLLGMIAAGRREVMAFTEKQIVLLENFASQAAIAIENARLLNETREALERQTATADVLKVISRSVFDLQKVLDTLVESAYRLCGANLGLLYLRGDDAFECKAIAGIGVAEASLLFKGRPIRAGRGTAAERVIMTGAVQSVTDFLEDPEFDPKTREVIRNAAASGASFGALRSTLAVPMARDNAVIGVLVIACARTGSFPPRQVELLQTFADQAVIAIENARLFDEVQTRTRELQESLQQQTATSEVLQAISRSTFDLDAILMTLVETAAQLCSAGPAQIFRRDGDVYCYAASRTLEPAYREHEQKVRISAGRGTLVGRMALEKRPVQIFDAWEDREYDDKEAARIGNIRSMLAVPLLRGGEPIGAFALARNHVEAFTDSQIKLVSTFADQAVIAIENVRLFNETRDALERQTATADILKVIASSPSNLKPVFDAIAERSNRLLGGYSTAVLRFDGEMLDLAAYTSTNPDGDAALRAAFPQPVANFPSFMLVRDGQTVQFADTEADGVPALNRDLGRARGYRSMLHTALMGDRGAIGMISVTREEPGTFAPHHVELLRTFADQAVIAIQNVRLFDEVQARTRDLEESLQFQTASADVLKVISQSPDRLQPVLDVIADTSQRLCNALTANIFLKHDDGKFHTTATAGEVRMRVQPLSLDQRGSATARAAREKRTVHVPNTHDDPEFHQGGPLGEGEPRAMLVVPLIRDSEVIGAITLRQPPESPFTQRQIEVVETFADQAVIAISNVGLFEQVQARTRELTKSLEDLRTAQDRLVQTEKLASLGQLTAGIAHEIKNPLNFVNNFSALSSELIDELLDVLKPFDLAGNTRQEVDELTHMLKDNLDKVVQHGKRADSIVKNMLLHSRAGAGERRPVEINGLVEESLNLAYHGARAEKQGFNITLKQDLDPDAGLADVFPQEITRVFLNLISNGFYAAAKRQAEIGDGFEPTLSASTRNLGDTIEICIRDNGTGIPAEVKDKMFNPFFTTKPAGEGTGLGLSISHDIIVKQHGGSIAVDTEPGQFTEFTIVLPRVNAAGPNGGERT